MEALVRFLFQFRRRVLPGIPTRTLGAIEWVAVIAGLLSGVVVQNHC